MLSYIQRRETNLLVIWKAQKTYEWSLVCILINTTSIVLLQQTCWVSFFSLGGMLSRDVWKHLPSRPHFFYDFATDSFLLPVAGINVFYTLPATFSFPIGWLCCQLIWNPPDSDVLLVCLSSAYASLGVLPFHHVCDWTLSCILTQRMWGEYLESVV